jgi:hypothetical protein
MELNNYVIAGAALAIAATSSFTTWLIVRPKKDDDEEVPRAKYRRVDVAAFKRSMTERYKHVDLVKVDDETKATLIKSIHTNIDKDIHNLFTEAEHAELLGHNESLFSKYS